MTELARTFSALGDSTRLAIVERLVSGEATITDFAATHHMTLAGAMKHIRVLEDAGLVRRAKRGRSVWCALSPGQIERISDWARTYSTFWDARLDSLSDHLRRTADSNE